METKTVKELMTPHPCLISPESTVDQAAQKMKEINCGVLPVGMEQKLEGILTDRDIVLRIVAEDLDANSIQVKDIMTPQVFSCKEDDTLQEAADEMVKHKIGRLVVLDKDHKVSGILSFGGLVRNTADQELISDVMRHVSAAATA